MFFCSVDLSVLFAMVRKGRVEVRPEPENLEMVRQDSDFKGRGDLRPVTSNLNTASPESGSWKRRAKRILKPAKLRACQDALAWEGRREGRPDGTAMPKVTRDHLSWKGRVRGTPQPVSLLTVCQQASCQETLGGVSTPEVHHVLAVDDSIIDRKVIEKLLKTSSYKVTTVDSAARALEMLGLSEGRTPSLSSDAFRVNLIITDYCMPGMTGYDLLKRVKAKTSALKEIPVVIMSSENVPNRIKRCLAEGAEEFIIKPVQMADVKRLQGHIKPLSRSSSTASGGSLGTSSSGCAKRKVSSPEDLQVMTSPERRPRLGGVIVA